LFATFARAQQTGFGKRINFGYQFGCRIVHFGVGMDAWVESFRAKSRRRRGRTIVRERAMKAGVLMLLAAGIAGAVYIAVNDLAG